MVPVHQKKVVIDTLNKSTEYLDFIPIKTAGLGKGIVYRMEREMSDRLKQQ